jgi:hypothetical protein
VNRLDFIPAREPITAEVPPGSVQDVLLLRNSDTVAQAFGPLLVAPGQEFRLPFEQAAEYAFASTAHAGGQVVVTVVALPDPGWERLRWRFAGLVHAVRYLKPQAPSAAA